MAVRDALMNPLELAAHGPVIPVMVIQRVQDAVPLARALLEGGVKVLEITLRTPVALACMREITRALPEATERSVRRRLPLRRQPGLPRRHRPRLPQHGPAPAARRGHGE
jgi:KDPG and KHG aldolase